MKYSNNKLKTEVSEKLRALRNSTGCSHSDLIILLIEERDKLMGKKVEK